MSNDNVVSLAAPGRFPTPSRTFFGPARGS